MRVFTTILFVFIAFMCDAQSNQPVPNLVSPTDLRPIQDARDPYEYQINLNKPVKEVISIFYRETDQKIDFKLSEDGKRIYLKEHDQKSAVEITGIDMTGEEVKITKSKCYIDPVILM